MHALHEYLKFIAEVFFRMVWEYAAEGRLGGKI